MQPALPAMFVAVSHGERSLVDPGAGPSTTRIFFAMGGPRKDRLPTTSRSFEIGRIHFVGEALIGIAHGAVGFHMDAQASGLSRSRR